MKYIRFEQINLQVARLTVNRPEVRNALNWQAMEEFSQVISDLERNKEVILLQIGGAEKAFISGADLDLVSKLDSTEDGEKLASIMGETLEKMRKMPLLTVAMIDGPARGGGAEIAVACDLRFMSEHATIGFVQASLGLIPGWGGAHRLFDLVGYSKALEYLASAKTIEASEALRVGLVNAVFPEHDFEAGVLAFVDLVSNNSQPAIRSIKELFLRREKTGDRRRRFEEREMFMEMWGKDERRERISRIMERKLK